MQPTAKLGELVSVLRSKNAGPFQITIDLMFADLASYRRVLDSGVLTADRVGDLYKVPPGEVQVIPFERVRAIKVTVPRPRDYDDPAVFDVNRDVVRRFLAAADVAEPAVPETDSALNPPGGKP